jgi:hypothetical protein
VIETSGTESDNNDGRRVSYQAVVHGQPRQCSAEGDDEAGGRVERAVSGINIDIGVGELR